MPFPLFVLIAFVGGGATLGACYAVRSRNMLAVGIALAGAFGLVVFHGPVYFDRFPGDDAFITFRYAENLAQGHGPNWNSTGRVEGYTSFLRMGLLAGTNKLGLDVVDSARVLTYLTTFGTLIGVLGIWRLWTRLADDRALASPLVPAITLVVLAIVDNVSFWSFSGLETPVYMLLLTASALLFMREHRLGGPPWSAVAFAAVAMTRPEGIVAASVTGLFLLDGLQHSATRKAAFARALTWAGTFWLLFGAYFTWRFAYFGHFHPNTYYAKTELSLAIYERGADYLASAVLHYHILPAFAGIALLFYLTSLRREAAYVGALSAGLLVAIIPMGGDAFGHGRLITPIVPLLYFAAITGFAVALVRLPASIPQKRTIAMATLAIIALVLLRGSDNPFLPEDRANQAERKVLGLWLNEHAPQDYTIAAWAVGSVAYHSKRDVLDLFGLTDEVITHTPVEDFGRGIAGHERYNVDYVLNDVQPEIIVTGDADPGPRLGDAFWGFYGQPGGLPAKKAIMTDPRLPEMYEPRAVQIEGLWFNFLQRKDTLAELQAAGLR